MNKIIGGEYDRGLINSRLQIIRGARKWDLDNKTVSKFEVINSDCVKSLGTAIGRGVVGGVVLGPLGMLGGAISGKNKKSYMVKIYYLNGRFSIAEVNQKIFKQMQLKLKVVM